MPTARGGLGVAIIGGHIVAVGGESPTGPMGVVESYNIARQDWAKGPSMRTPRHGLDVEAVGRRRCMRSAGRPRPGTRAR